MKKNDKFKKKRKESFMSEWTLNEEDLLLKLCNSKLNSKWKRIANILGNKKASHCKYRYDKILINNKEKVFNFENETKEDFLFSNARVVNYFNKEFNKTLKENSDTIEINEKINSQRNNTTKIKKQEINRDMEDTKNIFLFKNHLDEKEKNVFNIFHDEEMKGQNISKSQNDPTRDECNKINKNESYSSSLSIEICTSFTLNSITSKNKYMFSDSYFNQGNFKNNFEILSLSHSFNNCDIPQIPNLLNVLINPIENIREFNSILSSINSNIIIKKLLNLYFFNINCCKKIVINDNDYKSVFDNCELQIKIISYLIENTKQLLESMSN